MLRWVMRLLIVANLHAAVLANDSIIFDWTTQYPWVTEADIMPVPHYGNCTLCRDTYLSVYADLESLGEPIAVMMRNATAPVNGSKTPGALADLMNNVSYLDYVFADYEGNVEDQDVADTINLVRSHANPEINNARIGNYGEYPVAFDPTMPFSSQFDRSDRALFYLGSGLDIAQPSAYPYEYYANHFNRPDQHSTLSPSKRAALFWAPLQRVSLTKKELPEDHLLVPWLAGFISWENYEAEPPEQEDLMAMVQHVRLRGADGYATFRSKLLKNSDNGTLNSWIDNYSNENYRFDAHNAWEELDGIFDEIGETTILNLDTDKASGVEWSGIQRGNKVEILVSNLSNFETQVDLPEIAGLPDLSPPVAAGTHQRFSYTVLVSLPGDFNADGKVDGQDFLEWQRGYGSLYGPADLVEWETNFGASEAAQVAAVIPEPSSVLLVTMALVIGTTLRRLDERR